MLNFNLSVDNIAALIPCYTVAGDSVHLISRNGKVQDVPRSLRSVLKTLSRHYCLDLSVLRQKNRSLLHRQLHQPLFISSTLLLIPFKSRIPRIRGDCCNGYINYYAHPRFEMLPSSTPKQHSFKSIIRLSADISIPCCWSINTLQDLYRDAAYLAQHSTYRLDPVRSPQSVYEHHSLYDPLPAIERKLVEALQEVLRLKAGQ